MSQKDDLLIEVLRAAGHTDAADLASTVMERTRAGKTPPDDTPADKSTQPVDVPAGMRLISDEAYADEAGRRAEGEMLLAAARRAGVIAEPEPEEAA
jgi:hypothetical protein